MNLGISICAGKGDLSHGFWDVARAEWGFCPALGSQPLCTSYLTFDAKHEIKSWTTVIVLNEHQPANSQG